MLSEAGIYQPTLKKAFVIDRKIVNTAIGRDVAEALSAYDIPVLDSSICQRVAFAESATQGLTVYEIDPEMLASQEMTHLAKEVEGLLK
jgi:chromosome partitioning protein